MTSTTSFKLEPFLWIHLAGLAALPLLLQLVWLGLAVGQPFLPPWLELTLLATCGIAPILWMQWTRPFDIFCLVVVALRPEALNDDQRRLLHLFKAPRQRLFALIAAGFAFWALLWLYRWAPLASGVTLLAAQGRAVGLAIAALAFLASNLFWQVPVSVLGVLLRSQERFAETEPYARDRITQDFSVLGWRVARILPDYTLPIATVPTQATDEPDSSPEANAANSPDATPADL